MPRRRNQNDIGKVFLDMFMAGPTWLCLPVAVAVYLGVQIVFTIAAGMDSIFSGLAQNGPLLGGILAVGTLALGAVAALKKLERKFLYDRQTRIDSVRQLSWAEFELLIGEAYRRQGYQVKETGGGGPDGGIDLILRRDGKTTIVQCKQWKVYKVGVSPIRELYGVAVAQRADEAIFVTSGVYTQEARDFAKSKPLRLMDGDSLVNLIAPIRQAQQLSVAKAEDVPTTSLQCPRCRSSMILRTAKKGTNAGSRFWGCSTYPRCRGTIAA